MRQIAVFVGGQVEEKEHGLRVIYSGSEERCRRSSDGVQENFRQMHSLQLSCGSFVESLH